MTLAPVIGGSERQGFGKYSLCSGKKKNKIQRPSKGVHNGERPQIHYSAFVLDNKSYSNQHHKEEQFCESM